MKPANLIDLARRKGAVIATAESCTGGLISGAITEIPGSSDVFDRGFVTYSNAAKIEMLGIDPDTIKTFGAVSEEVAQAMASGALRHSDATLTVSVTGVAGPGGSDYKPEGRVCFAIAQNGTAPRVETIDFGPLGRAEVRQSTVSHALNLLSAALS
jgi:nicotinamide-nucleotide amidase